MRKSFICIVIFISTYSFSFAEMKSEIQSNDSLIVNGTLSFDSLVSKTPFGTLLLEDVDTKEKYITVSDSSGYFLFKLPTKVGRRKFNLVIGVAGFLTMNHKVLLPVGLFKVNLNDIVNLKMERSIGIICGPSINDINYEFNEFKFDSIGRIELDKLANVLKQNPTIIIEIGSHTDCIGSDTSNMMLSIKRAREVKRYLVSKGIERDRMKTTGFGESKPLNNCNCSKKKCSKEQYAENRRTEFRIIGTTEENEQYNSF